MRARARSLALAALVATPLGGCSEDAPASDGPDRLNLVVVSMDTMRFDRLSAYGRIERTTTPVLDKLAEESALFTDSLATSTVTGPSHLSLFTGQYPHRHGLTKNGGKVAPSYTLASLLAEAGWNTAGFTGGGFLRESFGLAHGFETYRAKGGPLARFKRTFATSMPHALEWLESRPPGPFFLFLHGYDPHCPYEASPAALRAIASRPRDAMDPEGKCGEEHYVPLLEEGELGEEELAYLVDLYDALVREADDSLKPLVHYLRKQRLLEETLFVFTSDHGESLGEHGWIGHGKLWDEQTRVPLFVRFPGGAFAGRYDWPVSAVDFVPTLLAALGVPAPDEVQGRNLLPLLEGEEAPASLDDRLRVVTFDDAHRAYFGRRHKLAFEGPELALTGAVDLERDPGESASVPVPDELAERFRSWRAATAGEDRRAAIAVGRPELDPEEAAELSALGYAESEQEP